jgi:hypothetical protein
MAGKWIVGSTVHAWWRLLRAIYFLLFFFPLPCAWIRDRHSLPLKPQGTRVQSGDVSTYLLTRPSSPISPAQPSLPALSCPPTPNNPSIYPQQTHPISYRRTSTAAFLRYRRVAARSRACSGRTAAAGVNLVWFGALICAGCLMGDGAGALCDC